MKDQWLNDIHDRMTDFGIDEPPGLWDDIATALAREDTATSRKKKPMALLWVRRAAGIAAMLAIAVGTLLWLGINTDMRTPQPSGKFTDISRAKTPDTTDDTADSPSARSTIQHNTAQYIAATHTQPSNAGIPAAPTQTIEKKPETAADTTARQIPGETAPNDMNAVPDYEKKLLHAESPTRRIAGMSAQTPRDSRLSMSVYTSGGLKSSFNRTSRGTHVSAAGPGNTEWEDNPLLGILLFNQGSEIETDITHHLPIRTGVSFDYRINDTFTIGTGITYSYLVSDLKFGSDSHYISGTQRLHYIGLPLSVRYRALSWKKIELYTSAGALAEKCIKGENEREYIIDRKNRTSESEPVRIRPLQWSVNASVGLQFNASHVIGLYAEPGVSYYFDNGSPIKTIYKDKPLNFNLNIGLRLTFGN